MEVVRHSCRHLEQIHLNPVIAAKKILHLFLKFGDQRLRVFTIDLICNSEEKLDQFLRSLASQTPIAAGSLKSNENIM